MRIVNVGICIDNLDPKGIGRIRYKTYGGFTSEMAGGVDYAEWSDEDPFVATPFLPTHINVVPQPNQSVKVIYYDGDKPGQNAEYISGPYTSPQDPQSQTYTSQHRYTTFGGAAVKNIKDIRNPKGELNSPVSKGVVINPKDYGLKGNYGSDVIFTEGGLQLRGGYLYSKESKKRNNRDYPQISKKMSRVSLKKFPSTFRPFREVVNVDKVRSVQIKYIIEYEIDDVISPSELKLYVYQVLANYNSEFNSDVFSSDSVFSVSGNSSIKLINEEGDDNSPTHTIPLDGTIESAYIETRNILFEINEKSLSVLSDGYTSDSIFPYYFRPTMEFRMLKPSTQAGKNSKKMYLSKVQHRKKTTSGLIFSRIDSNPPVTTTKKMVEGIRKSNNNDEQSFVNMIGDRIYLTSTDTNGTNVKTVNFENLDEYELTQENYLKDIEMNTYALVRGEILYQFIESMVSLMSSHRHNLNEPMVKTDQNWVRLNNLMQSLRDDLLNNSIRIN